MCQKKSTEGLKKKREQNRKTPTYHKVINPKVFDSVCFCLLEAGEPQQADGQTWGDPSQEQVTY